MISVPKAALVGVASLLATAASACLDTDDHADMYIDVYWDQARDADLFSGTSCSIAGVAKMQWTLTNTDEGKQVAEGTDRCCVQGVYCDVDIDALIIHDPKPGAYALAVIGFDDADQARWGATCADLLVTRFNVSYPCDVPEPGQ